MATSTACWNWFWFWRRLERVSSCPPTSPTMCCASPTWAVGLALLGVGVSTAFQLQPFGADITLAGFGLLLAANYILARDHPIASAADVAAPRLAQHQA